MEKILQACNIREFERALSLTKNYMDGGAQVIRDLSRKRAGGVGIDESRYGTANSR